MDDGSAARAPQRPGPAGDPQHAIALRCIGAAVISAGGNTSEYSACIAYTCDRIFAYDIDGPSAETCPPID